jgi:hypothetical protein
MRFLRAEMPERMAISAFWIAPEIAGRARGARHPQSTLTKAEALSSIETVLMPFNADDDSRF